MNKSFIQINDNYATVSDENGNIRLVSKKNNKTSFEEILTKENELEEKENSLKEAKEDLSINKNNIIGGEILNLTLYGGTAFLYFFMNGKVAPVGTATITALYYGTLKVVACAMSGGTRIRKIKDRKALKKEISELEEIVPQLRNELQNTKGNVQYEDNVASIDECDPTPFRQITGAVEDLKDNKESSEIKILALTRKNA